MFVFLRAKALKTENGIFFLCEKFARCVISFHRMISCMLVVTNCVCYMDLGLRALIFPAPDGSWGSHARNK